MANIIDDLKGMVTNQVISGAATYLGESEGGISKAIGGLFPTILAGLVNKSTDSQSFNGIFNLLSDSKNLGFLDNIFGLIGGGNLAQGDPKDIAGGLMGNLFGHKVVGILDLISNYAAVKKSSSSSLLGLVGPLIMGFLGKKIKNEGLNEAGLASYLEGQKSNIMNALPSGMGNLLGFAAPNMGSASTNSSDIAKAGGNNWWPWLIGILAIFAALYFWKGCNEPNVEGTVDNTTEPIENTVDTTSAVVDTAAEAVTDAAAGVGTFFKKKLACGVELNIPENGMESNLVAFIEDKTKPVDKTTWFTFDRLTFETGSSKLNMAKSAEQLSNIVEIMKCYPNVRLKIGGYTDNVGNKESNMKLSADRAYTVQATLVGLQIAPNRMEAEGYGDAHPIAPNDTEENKAKNRRIDVRVMAK